MQQRSAPLEQLAAAHHLGRSLAIYPARVLRSNLLYGLVGVLLIGGLTLDGMRSHQWLVLLPLLLVVLCLAALLESTFMLRGLRMVVCSEGLMRVSQDAVESIRWEEIRELWRDRRGTYRFSGTGGTCFMVNHVFRRAEELGLAIEEEVTRRLLPSTLGRYDREETIRFGRLAVSHAGLSLQEQTLPWRDLWEITEREGILVITAHEVRQVWSRVSLAETPNVCVLAAFIETLFDNQEGDADA